MKYYAVLDPISNTDPKSFFARPRKFNREMIISQLRNQTSVKLFFDEVQAVHFARSLSKKARPPKASGLIAPIIECECKIPDTYEKKGEFCIAPDDDPDVTKTHRVGIFIEYFLVESEFINNKDLVKCFFSKENIPTIHLNHKLLPCLVL